MFSGLLTLTTFTYTHGLMLVMLQSESYAYLYICINLIPQLKMDKKKSWTYYQRCERMTQMKPWM